MPPSGNILIISFYFPPDNRVGGRRWAKHTKWLLHYDIKPFVLAGEFETQTSKWTKDIEPYAEHIYRIPVRMVKPYYKRALPKNPTQKLIWKASYLWGRFKEKTSKGSFSDTSTKYVDQFLAMAIDIIQKNKIGYVILSVGPYHYAKILIELKKRFPALITIIDYRDYWEDGFEGLSEKQTKYEKNLQETILKYVDHVITVNDELSTYFKNTLIHPSVYTLPHSFDPNDISTSPSQKKTITAESVKRIKLIYGGALYSNLEKYLTILSDLIKELQKKDINVCTDLFVPHFKYENIINKPEALYNVHSYIATEEYFNEMQKADYVILFRPDWSPNAMSSKFFEIIAHRKPILYFGPQGAVSDFITKHGLGYRITSENINDKASELISNMWERNIPDLSYDLNQHTFEYQTKLLLDFLNKPI